MHRTPVLVAAVVFCAATALAQSTEHKRPDQRTQVPLTLSVLYQRIPDVQFRDTPLEQVMEWLADLMQLNVSVRWNLLHDVGIQRDTPVSIQARNLRLTQVLWLVMNEAGGSETRLAYRASGHLLVLSTAQDLDREMITRVYDVADLLISLPSAPRQSDFDVTQNLGQSGSGGGSSSSIFVGKSSGSSSDDPNARAGESGQVQQLIELIQQTIEPESWHSVGGTGTIVAFHNLLIVRNTIAVHQRLGGYVTEEEAAGH